MSQIGLADFDGPLGKELATEMAGWFWARKHSVTQFRSGASVVRAWKELGVCPDVLYLYVQSPNGQVERYLDQLRNHWRDNGPRPLVQCVLERNFGPDYHLSLEKRWARVTYNPKTRNGAE
jgi:hypothetical protein